MARPHQRVDERPVLGVDLAYTPTGVLPGPARTAPARRERVHVVAWGSVPDDLMPKLMGGDNLGDDFELVWCSGWEEKANDHLPHLMGLPTLPHLLLHPRLSNHRLPTNPPTPPPRKRRSKSKTA